jgi:hypothetical protein
VPALVPPRRVALRRERWDTPDGDFIDVDFCGDPGAKTQLVLFHGLEGGSDSHYARAIASHAVKSGWRLAIAHFRGCSGELNRTARAYHSGDSEEIDWVLKRFGAPVYAVGVSLGGNALLKWLGERGAEARALVRRAAAVSAPLDLAAAGNALDRGLNRFVYTRHFLSTLRPKALAKLAVFPDLYDKDKVRAARTFREFDNLVTAPLHGFRNTEDYWNRSSSKPWLKHIEVPTLIINAINDPFMPAHALPRPTAVSSMVVLEFPGQGGHVGFLDSPFPGRLTWLPERIVSFFGEQGSQIGLQSADMLPTLQTS